MNARFNGDINIAGAILAGGRASRFEGRPKGLLHLPDGQTFIARLLAEMNGAGLDTVVISANEKEPYADLGALVIPDLRPSIGPLGGIEAVLSHYRQKAGAVLFLPCDLPRLTRHEIQRLLDSFRQRPEGILSAETADGAGQPLCSVVPVAMLDQFSEAVRSGRFGMKKLWNELGAGAVRFDRSDRFFNINSQSDYDKLLTTISSLDPPGKTTRPAE
jgi:molybdopterin-guanine dinucleotide biosynthesis protein A